MQRWLFPLLASTSLFLATPALAQEDVAQSGMSQGHARVAARSDVTISLESVPGTSGARIAILGRGVQAFMPRVRACFADAVRLVPATHGRLRVRLDLPPEGAATAAVVENTVGESPLVACVTGVLDDLTLEPAQRPAGAIIVLDFDSTAAQGGDAVARSQAEADAVTVTREGGVPEARADVAQVHILVRGAADASDALIAEAVRVVRAQVAGLLDCRRRASRRGASPEGVVRFDMRLQPPRVVLSRPSATVADTRAPRCVQTAVERARRAPTESGSVQLEVRFDR